MRFNVMGDMIYISYRDWVGSKGDIMNCMFRDRVTDEQRQGRSGKDMMNNRYKEILTCEQETW